MPAYRGKMFFSQGNSGWTDEFFVKGSTMQEAFPDLRALAEARAGLLGAGAELVRFELSRIHGWRQTLASGVRTKPLSLPARPSFDGLLLQLQAGGTGDKPSYRRTWLMRGLPVGFVAAGPNPAAGNLSAVNAAMAAWLQLLGNGKYFLQVADKTTGWHKIGQMIPFAIENMSLDGKPMDPAGAGPGQTALAILLADEATIPATDPETAGASRVFLRDVRWTPASAGRAAGLTGEKVVLASLPGLLSVRSDVPKTGQFAGSAWLTLRRTVYEPIARAIAIGQGQRKCGKPIAGYRAGPREVVSAQPIASPPTPAATTVPAQPGDFSETTTISNARELIEQVYVGYDPLPDGTVHPVRIAPIMGFPNSYVVLCSGTDLGTSSATGIPQDLAAALALPSSFTAGLAAAIVDGTQPGATLFMAGHSLGGMVLQNAIWWGIPRDRKVSVCVCYGSPVTIIPIPGIGYRFFKLPGDQVPSLSLGSILAGPFSQSLMTTLDPGDIPPGPVSRHTHYQDCIDLENWSPAGFPLTSPEVQKITVGKWKSYPLPRLTI